MAYTIIIYMVHFAKFGLRRSLACGEGKNSKSNYKLKNKRRIMEKKEMYLAPEVEILEVMVEKGYAGSIIEDGGGVDTGDDDWGGA